MTQPLTWHMPDASITWDSPAGLSCDEDVPVSQPKSQAAASDNRISIEITAAQKTAIVNAVTALKIAFTGIIKRWR